MTAVLIRRAEEGIRTQLHKGKTTPRGEGGYVGGGTAQQSPALWTPGTHLQPQDHEKISVCYLTPAPRPPGMVTLPWQPQHANSPFPDTDTEAQRVARHLRPTAGDTQAQGTWLQDLGLHPAPPPQHMPH